MKFFRKYRHWVLVPVFTLIILWIAPGVSQWMLVMCAGKGNLIGVRILLSFGVDPNAKIMDPGDAIITAAQRGRTAVVSLLLEKGADPNAVPEGAESALMYAAGHDHPGTLKALLAGGADPNYDDGVGGTPMMFAEGYPDEIRILKQAGAKPSRK